MSASTTPDSADNQPQSAQAPEPAGPAPLPAELTQIDPGILVDSIREGISQAKTRYYQQP